MCKRVMAHIWMSHGTHVWIESCRHVKRALIWVMAHVQITHGTKLWHICEHRCKWRICVICTCTLVQIVPCRTHRCVFICFICTCTLVPCRTHRCVMCTDALFAFAQVYMCKWHTCVTCTCTLVQRMPPYHWYRSLLQKSPIKEMIFRKRDL